MKLLSFQFEGQTLYGPKVKREEAVWDALALANHYGDTSLPTTIIEGVALGLDFVESIRKLVNRAEKDGDASDYKYSFSSIEWLAPIPRTPKNVICVGKNYFDHATEMGDEAAPEKLMIFTKSPTTIAADEQQLPIHSEVTENLDYEGELAVVISKKGNNIPAAIGI